MRSLLTAPRGQSFIVLFFCFSALGTALFSQYVGGLLPCVLCIYQRYAYGAAIAAGFAGLVTASNSFLHRLTMIAAGVSFLAGSGIAAFHAGVEQKWWRGTDGCHAPELDTNMTIDEMKDALLGQPFVACDEVPWDLFGISIAGYNFLAMLGFAVFCFWMLRQRREA